MEAGSPRIYDRYLGGDLMARTKATIQDELERLAPAWIRNFAIGRALLGGLAKLYSSLETRYEAWHTELQRQTATGDYLDSHGEDAGVERDPWEDDLEFRDRAIIAPRGATPKFLEDETTRVAFPYADGYHVDFLEPKLATADVDVYADLTPVYGFEPEAEEPKFVAGLALPVGEVPTADGFFADFDHADFEFGDPLPWNLLRNQFERPIGVMTRSRPAAVGIRVEIRDTLQTAQASTLLLDVMHG